MIPDDSSTTSIASLTSSSTYHENRQILSHFPSGKQRPCPRMCPRALAIYTAVLTERWKMREGRNFILIAAKYIKCLYYWTQCQRDKYILADKFVKSVAASLTLFAIGMKLTTELMTWTLPIC